MNDVFSQKTFDDTWWADLLNKTAYMVNPKGELWRYIPHSGDKDGELIRKRLPHDFLHPDWRKKI